MSSVSIFAKMTDQLSEKIRWEVEKMIETKTKKVWLRLSGDLPDSADFQQQVEHRVNSLGVIIEWVNRHEINLVLIK